MTDKPIIFMFSGQGSQYIDMGKALFEENSNFRAWMMQLDGIVQRVTGNSIIRVLYATDRNQRAAFARTAVTHPAIFMVEYSLAKSLIEYGVVPNMTLGVSVGSFAAASIAGCIDVADALRTVLQHASALEKRCEPGGMLAVLDNPELFAERFLADNCELAAVNFSSHFVISAQEPNIGRIEDELRGRSVSYQRLPVAYAFHSRWIDPARSLIELAEDASQFKTATIPMMCCERAELVTDLTDHYFWRTARGPMRLREAIEYLEGSGTYRYVDVGPSGTLATLLKYLKSPDSASTSHSIITPFGREVENFANLTGPGHRMTV